MILHLHTCDRCQASTRPGESTTAPDEWHTRYNVHLCPRCKVEFEAAKAIDPMATLRIWLGKVTGRAQKAD